MSYKKPKEHYEHQFERITVPITGKGLPGFVDWYRLIVRAAFLSGIKDGY